MDRFHALKLFSFQKPIFAKHLSRCYRHALDEQLLDALSYSSFLTVLIPPAILR